MYKKMAEDRLENVVVRYRGSEPGCDGCLRITVGTDKEMEVLKDKLEQKLKEEL